MEQRHTPATLRLWCQFNEITVGHLTNAILSVGSGRGRKTILTYERRHIGGHLELDCEVRNLMLTNNYRDRVDGIEPTQAQMLAFCDALEMTTEGYSEQEVMGDTCRISAEVPLTADVIREAYCQMLLGEVTKAEDIYYMLIAEGVPA